MGLNRDFISRKYSSSILISSTDIASYGSAIGAKINAAYDIDAPPCFSVTYELPLIYKILEDVDLHGTSEQICF